jgi:hypothetical protein
MKIAIMQPYLFPYIGYWQLMNTVDTFVLYDNIQFTKKGWFHRNNILANGKKTLFTIPLNKDSDFLDVRDRFLADDSKKQITKIVSQIEQSYKKAPYFSDVYPIIKNALLNNEKNLFNYILNSIHTVCSYLNIKTKIIISSEINIDHSLRSQEKVITLCKTLNAANYINPIGGMNLYDKSDFTKNGITLKFLHTELIEYPQFKPDFEPYMSIIDIMMFNSKAEISDMLEKFKLI